MSTPPRRAEIVVDLAAIGANVRRLRELTGSNAPGGPAFMVVVKADGYGHGLTQVASAARSAGAEWLGVADLGEALALRAAGDNGRILSWLELPGDDPTPALEQDVDLAVYSVKGLAAVVGAAAATQRSARIHLKVDTGLSRGGCPMAGWPALLEQVASAQGQGRVEVVGIWSHLACADEPDHPANAEQETAFAEALALAEAQGVRPELRHLANSAAALLRPSARFDLVRIGLAAYGLSPAPGVFDAAAAGLMPAMTVRARAALVKEIPAGAGVSYGHRYLADHPHPVALVPIGYADGVPRHASGRGQVLLGGVRGTVLGTICMDQFVVEAPQSAAAGDEVVVFGPGHAGEPTAEEWAEWAGTIAYEIVTRIGGPAGRAVRRWVGDPTLPGAT